MTLPSGGYVLTRDGGEPIWFLGTRMTVKAGRDQTGGALTVIDCECPPGFGPPLHVHRDEDEMFFLLEGALSVSCGAQRWRVDTGGFVFLPKGVAHRFSVLDGRPARLLQLTTPAQFEQFALEAGAPATGSGLPEPQPPDLKRLFAAATRYHIDILPEE